jgi:hypothetical protein
VARADPEAASLLRSWRGFGSCSAARPVVVEFDVPVQQGVITRPCREAAYQGRRVAESQLLSFSEGACLLDPPLLSSPTRSKGDVAHAGLHGGLHAASRWRWRWPALRARTRTRTRTSSTAGGKAGCCRKRAHGKGKRHGGVWRRGGGRADLRVVKSATSEWARGRQGAMQVRSEARLPPRASAALLQKSRLARAGARAC